jgi:hypothetical protein
LAGIAKMSIATDLFLEPKTKKQQILDFIKQKKWVRTSEVIAFGLSIYTDRGDRYARDLASEGKIRRMPKDLKNFRFNNTKESIWEFVG